MRIIRQLIVAAFALILAVGMASARSLTDDESRSLADTVAAFDAAMRDSDYETVGKTVPPKILGHIAKSAGIEIEALRKVMMDQMKSMLSTVKISSFDMDLPKAEHRELSSGEPYVLIPTETVIEAADGRSGRGQSPTRWRCSTAVSGTCSGSAIPSRWKSCARYTPILSVSNFRRAQRRR